MGFLGWIFGSAASISVDEAQSQLGQFYILDVRQPVEFESGHIKGAKLVPLNRLAEEVKTLPEGKDILCVCRSGARSGSAARRLNKAGLQAVNLRGGMLAWARAGLPIKKGRR